MKIIKISDNSKIKKRFDHLKKIVQEYAKAHPKDFFARESTYWHGAKDSVRTRIYDWASKQSHLDERSVTAQPERTYKDLGFSWEELYFNLKEYENHKKRQGEIALKEKKEKYKELRKIVKEYAKANPSEFFVGTSGPWENMYKDIKRWALKQPHLDESVVMQSPHKDTRYGYKSVGFKWEDIHFNKDKYYDRKKKIIDPETQKEKYEELKKIVQEYAKAHLDESFVGTGKKWHKRYHDIKNWALKQPHLDESVVVSDPWSKRQYGTVGFIPDAINFNQHLYAPGYYYQRRKKGPRSFQQYEEFKKIVQEYAKAHLDESFVGTGKKWQHIYHDIKNWAYKQPHLDESVVASEPWSKTQYKNVGFKWEEIRFNRNAYEKSYKQKNEKKIQVRKNNYEELKKIVKEYAESHPDDVFVAGESVWQGYIKDGVKKEGVFTRIQNWAFKQPHLNEKVVIGDMASYKEIGLNWADLHFNKHNFVNWRTKKKEIDPEIQKKRYEELKKIVKEYAVANPRDFFTGGSTKWVKIYKRIRDWANEEDQSHLNADLVAATVNSDTQYGGVGFNWSDLHFNRDFSEKWAVQRLKDEANLIIQGVKEFGESKEGEGITITDPQHQWVMYKDKFTSFFTTWLNSKPVSEDRKNVLIRSVDVVTPPVHQGIYKDYLSNNDFKLNVFNLESHRTEEAGYILQALKDFWASEEWKKSVRTTVASNTQWKVYKENFSRYFMTWLQDKLVHPYRKKIMVARMNSNTPYNTGTYNTFLDRYDCQPDMNSLKSFIIEHREEEALYIIEALRTFEDSEESNEIVITSPGHQWETYREVFSAFFAQWLKDKPLNDDRKQFMIDKMMSGDPVYQGPYKYLLITEDENGETTNHLKINGERRIRNKERLSFHQSFTAGKKSRSDHEIVIRDILFFLGEEFVYEPEDLYAILEMEDYSHEVIYEEQNDLIHFVHSIPQLSITHMEDFYGFTKEEVQELDETPYQKKLIEPDFLLSNGKYFEVFGGRALDDFRETFKIKYFPDLQYIQKDSLKGLFKDRSLILYANRLDTSVCEKTECEGADCKSKCGQLFPYSISDALHALSPLLLTKGVDINAHHVEFLRNTFGRQNPEREETKEEKEKRTLQLQEMSQTIGEQLNWEYYEQYYFHYGEPFSKWLSDFVNRTGRSPSAQEVHQATQNEFLELMASPEWQKISPEWQTTEAQVKNDRPKIMSIPNIVKELTSQGFWSAFMWNDSDKVAIYYRTEERWNQAMEDFGAQKQKEVMEFPINQQEQPEEQQVAAFNLSTLKKEARYFYNQTFSDDTGTWNVPDILDHAKQYGKLTEIPVKDLLNNLEPSPQETGDELPGSPEFIERSEKADFNYPIIVIKYPDGLFIADGVHRLWKAKDLGVVNMKAYLMDYTDLENLEPSEALNNDTENNYQGDLHMSDNNWFEKHIKTADEEPPLLPDGLPEEEPDPDPDMYTDPKSGKSINYIRQEHVEWILDQFMVDQLSGATLSKRFSIDFQKGSGSMDSVVGMRMVNSPYTKYKLTKDERRLLASAIKERDVETLKSFFGSTHLDSRKRKKKPKGTSLNYNPNRSRRTRHPITRMQEIRDQHGMVGVFDLTKARKISQDLKAELGQHFDHKEFEMLKTIAVTDAYINVYPKRVAVIRGSGKLWVVDDATFDENMEQGIYPENP